MSRTHSLRLTVPNPGGVSLMWEVTGFSIPGLGGTVIWLQQGNTWFLGLDKAYHMDLISQNGQQAPMPWMLVSCLTDNPDGERLSH